MIRLEDMAPALAELRRRMRASGILERDPRGYCAKPLHEQTDAVPDTSLGKQPADGNCSKERMSS
jgi:hypothetical protein